MHVGGQAPELLVPGRQVYERQQFFHPATSGGGSLVDVRLSQLAVFFFGGLSRPLWRVCGQLVVSDVPRFKSTHAAFAFL